MKWKFLMILVLIQGLKQPNNDIDVYLKPLSVEELYVDMTPLRTTIHAKDKVNSFICILFSYFENRLLPKDIIIIRNHGEDKEIIEERHRCGEG